MTKLTEEALWMMWKKDTGVHLQILAQMMLALLLEPTENDAISNTTVLFELVYINMSYWASV